MKNHLFNVFLSVDKCMQPIKQMPTEDFSLQNLSSIYTRQSII